MFAQNRLPICQLSAAIPRTVTTQAVLYFMVPQSPEFALIVQAG